MDSPRSDEVAGLDWALRSMEALGLRPAGAPERVKTSAWSTVYTIPAADGRLWLKANGGDTLYEARLAQALAAWAPDKVLAPLAVDGDRGWQLLPDGGTPLRGLAANRDHRAWERFAARYAELQREVTPYAGKLLDLGVPDHRPAALPGHFAALLGDPGVAIVEDRRVALKGLRAGYAEACSRLAGAGPPPTIQHDDLHSNNVLPGPAGDRFFDWGDASLGHPFASLLVTRRSMAATFERPLDDPILRRLRDAYLEPWGLGADGPDLVELAEWTGTVGRALSWRRALTAADEAELAEYGGTVGRWLEELLAPPDPG